MLVLSDIKHRLERGETEIPVRVGDQDIITLLEVSSRQRQSLLAGGMLNLVRQEIQGWKTVSALDRIELDINKLLKEYNATVEELKLIDEKIEDSPAVASYNFV